MLGRLPGIDAVTRALQQGTGVLPPAGDLAVLARWAAVGLIVSLVSFRWQRPWHPSRSREATDFSRPQGTVPSPRQPA